MADADVNALIDTVDATSNLRLQLTDLLEALHAAKTQVTSSALASRQQLEKHFCELRSSICQAIDARLDELVKEVNKIENTAQGPLIKCEELIQTSLRSAADIMEGAKSILMKNPHDHMDEVKSFKLKADQTMPINMPEVPSLSTVACISLDLPSITLEDTIQRIANHGVVFSRPPVYISDVAERPGALLLKWTEVDEDIDISEFRLQYGSGDLTENENNNGNFCDAYRGPNTSFLLHNLKDSQQYSFRVCCKGEKSHWSPWSGITVASTSLPHHEWLSTREGYYTTVDNTFTTKETPCCPLVVYSKNSSYICGHQIQFKIVDIGVPDPLDALGLSIRNDQQETLGGPGVLCVNMSGKIYVDGQKIVNQLPALVLGSVLTIETEILNPAKVRVTIETGEREVTVDWKITPDENDVGASIMGVPIEKPPPMLYFGACFVNENWKVSVL